MYKKQKEGKRFIGNGKQSPIIAIGTQKFKRHIQCIPNKKGVKMRIQHMQEV
jgi:hypothetical protein